MSQVTTLKAVTSHIRFFLRQGRLYYSVEGLKYTSITGSAHAIVWWFNPFNGQTALENTYFK